MNTKDINMDLAGWLKDQVRTVSEAIKELEKIQNYGKATLCEGMREAYTRCLEKIQAA